MLRGIYELKRDKESAMEMCIYVGEKRHSTEINVCTQEIKQEGSENI